MFQKRQKGIETTFKKCFLLFPVARKVFNFKINNFTGHKER